jgi:hypothetical protein
VAPYQFPSTNRLVPFASFFNFCFLLARLVVPYTSRSLFPRRPFSQVSGLPSYAQDLGIGVVTHGLYCSFQGLGSIMGCIAAFPCRPCPNPFREVNQGQSVLILLKIKYSFIINRCCLSRFPLRSLLQGCRFRVNVCTESQDCRCQDSDRSHRTSDVRPVIHTYISNLINI